MVVVVGAEAGGFGADVVGVPGAAVVGEAEAVADDEVGADAGGVEVVSPVGCDGSAEVVVPDMPVAFGPEGVDDVCSAPAAVCAEDAADPALAPPSAPVGGVV